MSLSDLSAQELARIDAICLDYESSLRAGNDPVIDEIVDARGGQHAELLRSELQAIRDELSQGGATVVPDAQPDRTSTWGFDEQNTVPPIGKQLGPYLITDTLGRGGMGVVYKAVDQRLDRVVAIKMLAIGGAKQRELTERFEREAKAVAAISHPNIVELFDVGVNDGLPYAVMEHLAGDTLDAIFKQGALTADDVRILGFQIADALATAHAGGVIHRDLKPHNVMLVPRSTSDASASSMVSGSGRSASSNSVDGIAKSRIVKLFDFGLSRVPRDSIDDDKDSHTRAGVVLGTPGYMAPEQARGEGVTAAADLFGLGCVLFEAFYGKRAFDGDTSAARYASTLEDTPVPDPIRRRDDVALADVIDRCLQKKPNDRPESAADIAAILRDKEAPLHPILTKTQSGYTTGQWARRHFLELLGGGILGSVLGSAFKADPNVRLHAIKSLAVLSLTDASSIESSTLFDVSPSPIGKNNLHRGEQISALLVNELTRLMDVSVPPFRPMTAQTPQEFRQLGEQLEVDALLTGTYRTRTQGAKEFLDLDLQIISAQTGNRLWGDQIHSDAGDNLLEQSKLATEIAAQIGHRLTSTADQPAPPNVSSFSCLVDGKTRSDPDSVPGLEMALMCFQKAHEADDRFVDPLAGIALTSVTLAAQSETTRAVELMQAARTAAGDALELDPSSIDARLAFAILDWQTVSRYTEAERRFRELAIRAPNNWQIQHQYGLLQLTMGDTAAATKSLREASQLNPMSVVVKVDRARAMWFAGNTERALDDAKRIQSRFANQNHANGLLVDIYEHQARYHEAAAIHDNFPLKETATAQHYFEARANHLEDLPYGPFGPDLNQAIWETRTSRSDDESRLANLADNPPPMLPYLLASHPSFSRMRLLERAKDMLPGS